MRVTIQNEQSNMKEVWATLQTEHRRNIEFFKYQREHKEELEKKKRRIRWISK